MCERLCPRCGSKDHQGLHGITGLYLYCTGCHTLLATRVDIDAAPLHMTYDEAEAWQRAGSGVLAGAEAADPEDDKIFGPNRWPLAERTD